MSYNFNSKYKKTNTFNPDQEQEPDHYCCHHPKEAALKKTLANQDFLSSSRSAQSDQYTYKSPYSQASLHPELQHQCCNHDEIRDENSKLQNKNSETLQNKSKDFIQKRREEEQKKNS